MTRPGTYVHVDYRKWGGAVHWQEPAVWLGRDRFGTWLYSSAASPSWRPQATFLRAVDAVWLVPDAPWVATFSSEGAPVRVYVDVTTAPQWSSTDDGLRIEVVDLDLDVVRPADGEPFVDDEDEFAEHRVSLGYPPEVVDLARRTADDLLAQVTGRVTPFDDTTPERWRTQGRALGLDALPAIAGGDHYGWSL